MVGLGCTYRELGHQSKACPQLWTMTRGTQLDQSRGLSVPLVRGGGFSVTGATSGVPS